jgi:hypothetical protein
MSTFKPSRQMRRMQIVALLLLVALPSSDGQGNLRLPE